LRTTTLRLLGVDRPLSPHHTPPPFYSSSKLTVIRFVILPDAMPAHTARAAVCTAHYHGRVHAFSVHRALYRWFGRDDVRLGAPLTTWLVGDLALFPIAWFEHCRVAATHLYAAGDQHCPSFNRPLLPPAVTRFKRTNYPRYFTPVAAADVRHGRRCSLDRTDGRTGMTYTLRLPRVRAPV
jgi:hypothetical protein